MEENNNPIKMFGEENNDKQEEVIKQDVVENKKEVKQDENLEQDNVANNSETMNQNETSYEQKVHEPEVINTNSNVNYNQSSQKKSNTCALASFVCSMVGLLIFGIPCGIAAVVTGIIGLVKFDSSKENNKWMAIVGICVGAFDFILVAIYRSRIVAMSFCEPRS